MDTPSVALESSRISATKLNDEVVQIDPFRRAVVHLAGRSDRSKVSSRASDPNVALQHRLAEAAVTVIEHGSRRAQKGEAVTGRVRLAGSLLNQGESVMWKRGTTRDLLMRGSSTARIDAQGRMRIPQPFRAILTRYGRSCYLFLFPSPRAGIGIFALATWQDIVSRRRRTELPSRVFCGATRTMDSHGGISVPEEFLLVTQLAEHVVVLGYGEYLTICNPETVEQQPAAFVLSESDAQGSDESLVSVLES